METPMVFFGQYSSDLVQHRELFIRHGHLDVALEHRVELRPRHGCQIVAVEKWYARVDRALDAREFRLRVRPVLAHVIHLEFLVPRKVRKGGIDRIRNHHKVDRLVRVPLTDAERQSEFRHRQIFICHPRRDFDDFVVIRVHVSRRFHRIAHTVEHRAPDRFWPVHVKVSHYASRARIISASPARKQPNMAAINRLVPGGAARNSFQMNTPQKAATIVAPCPSPYEIANPARPDAMMLNDMPIPQIIPPRTPVRWVRKSPLKYSA